MALVCQSRRLSLRLWHGTGEDDTLRAVGFHNTGNKYDDAYHYTDGQVHVLIQEGVNVLFA